MTLKELNIEKEDFLTCLPRPVKGRGHVRENSEGFAISDSRDTLWGLSKFNIPNSVAMVQWPTIPFDLGPGATNPAFIRPKDQNAVEISAIEDIGDGGACFPGGLSLTQGGDNLGFRAVIPAPIDEWLLFDQAGINNNDASTGTRVRDYYSIDIPGLTNEEEQTFLNAIGDPNASFPYSDANLRTLLMGDGGGRDHRKFVFQLLAGVCGLGGYRVSNWWLLYSLGSKYC